MPALFSGQIRVSGVSVGSHADQQDMIRAIEVNGLRPPIDRRFALEELTAAFAYCRGRSPFGKVSVEI